jgi:hypothetical protein
MDVLCCEHVASDKRRWLTLDARLAPEARSAAVAMLVLLSAPHCTAALSASGEGDLRTRWCNKCAVWVTRHMGWVASRRDTLSAARVLAMAPEGVGEVALLKRAAAEHLVRWAEARLLERPRTEGPAVPTVQSPVEAPEPAAPHDEPLSEKQARALKVSVPRNLTPPGRRRDWRGRSSTSRTRRLIFPAGATSTSTCFRTKSWP